jgi:molecular chaperone HscB
MQDPFKTLGLPRRYDLNEADLHPKFIQLSSVNHPDRYSDPVDQADAAERSAEINQAYATLKDPQRRADALLILIGGPAKEQDKSLPPDLLMDMMETRESMEEAIAQGNLTQLDELRAWGQDQKEAHLKKIADLFGEHENNLPEDAGKTIRVELNTLRYIQRMLEQMPR